MKTWIITLPFLCSVGVAMAQDVEKERAADQPQATAAPAERAAAQMTPPATQAEPVAVPIESAAIPAKGKTQAKAKAQAKTKAPTKASSRSRMGKQGPRRLPTGDMRYCLDKKTRAAIIRCSETQPKK